MSREEPAKISYPDSVSFPNTRMQTAKPLEMGSKVFRFQPVRSDVLLKQLLELENEEESPEKSPKPKTSYMEHRGNKLNLDESSSDEDSNILDKTIVEDDSGKDLVAGVSWLDSPPNRKPFKIISKPVPSTPMTNMFNKLTTKDHIKNECKSFQNTRNRPSSLDRNSGDRLLQTPVNTFKTPFNNYLTSQKPIESAINIPKKGKQLELGTPKTKMPVQIKNVDTPRHGSILDAAIRKNFNTPRPVLPALKDDKINIKKTDIILREKNMNVETKETVEVKQPEIKQPVVRQLVKQSSTGDLKLTEKTKEEKQVPIKTNEKPRLSNEGKQVAIKTNEKPRLSNEEKQVPIKTNEKPRLSNEEKPKPKNVVATIPAKPLQESTFQQLKVRGKDYIVINKIGEGGSGQVYRCLEQDTLQDRAIKVVNLNVDATTVESYINEVKMLNELQGNDRVIRMYDYEKVNQNLFVVMEKGDVDFSIFLRNIINEPQIQTHVIVCYWIEMLKCVREIHKKGIIHSDLKPSNFLIVGGRLKLIDFGIASRLTAEMTSVIKNVTVGTFNYISPEALLDSRECPTDEKPQLRISYKSDVWSLGCILYQMVYKKTPFHSVGNMWAKFAVITDRNHKIEYQQICGVPLYLIDMIKKCLVYDMRSRPTVDELLNMYYTGNYC